MPEISACGGRVVLGTDCNARIDMLEEARWLEYTHRLRHLRRGVAVDAMMMTATTTSDGDDGNEGGSVGGEDEMVSAGAQLLDIATARGAVSLGLGTWSGEPPTSASASGSGGGTRVGRVEKGYAADFCAVNLDAPQLRWALRDDVGNDDDKDDNDKGLGFSSDALAGALVFGCAADAVVSETCVAGRWRSTA